MISKKKGARKTCSIAYAIDLQQQCRQCKGEAGAGAGAAAAAAAANTYSLPSHSGGGGGGGGATGATGGGAAANTYSLPSHEEEEDYTALFTQSEFFVLISQLPDHTFQIRLHHHMAAT